MANWVGLSRETKTIGVTLVVVIMLVLSAVWIYEIVIAAVVVLSGIALLWFRNNTGENEELQSIWDLIPHWQYDGHHVQSGGLSRQEQEHAIRDINREAAKRRDEK